MPARRSPFSSPGTRFGYGGPTVSLPGASSSAYVSSGYVSDLVGRLKLAHVGEPIPIPPPPMAPRQTDALGRPTSYAPPAVLRSPARGESLETSFTRQAR